MSATVEAMTTDSMHKALVDAAERSLTTSDHTHDDILQLAEVAATLQAQQLAGNLLGLIRGRVKSDAAANGELSPEEVNALVKAYQLLKDYDNAPNIWSLVGAERPDQLGRGSSGSGQELGVVLPPALGVFDSVFRDQRVHDAAVAIGGGPVGVEDHKVGQQFGGDLLEPSSALVDAEVRVLVDDLLADHGREETVCSPWSHRVYCQRRHTKTGSTNWSRLASWTRAAFAKKVRTSMSSA
ncbi:MAG: hypothetical protein QOF30_3457 [Acidimicrobiaceae bacterium]|nr:hypothetical protein [Acidimicrobiaceae bacterium]